MKIVIANKKLENKISKIAKGDKTHAEAIFKAYTKIKENPYVGKPLRNKLKGTYRIHVYTSFVMIYEIKEEIETIVILEYEHHDKAY